MTPDSFCKFPFITCMYTWCLELFGPTDILSLFNTLEGECSVLKISII